MKTTPEEKKPLSAKMRVAAAVMAMAEENNAQISCDDEEAADLISKALAFMVACDNPSEVKLVNDAHKRAYLGHAPRVDLWTYLCLVTNWLSWAWNKEGEEELSKAWADAWYDIHDFSLEHLKGSNLKTYLEKVD